jgi:hypothetical protein
LVIEQLEIPIQDIHVACIASLEKFEEYQSLFKNYLPTFQRTSVAENKANEDHTEVLSHFFAQCVL